MKLQRANLVRVKCPHCAAPAITRTSKTLTSVYREIYYQCTNISCGSSFMASLEIVRMINPSLIPNPDVRLPTLSNRAPRTAAIPDQPANDHGPPPALATG